MNHLLRSLAAVHKLLGAPQQTIAAWELTFILPAFAVLGS